MTEFQQSIVESFNTLISQFEFLLDHPLLLLIAMVLSYLLYRFNTGMFLKAIRNAQNARTSGWNSSAKKSSRVNPVGIGTQDILTMRPPRRNVSIACWTLLFFGGGAIFMWNVPLQVPEEQTLKSWATFSSMLGFSGLSIFIFLMALTRIEATSEDITHKRIFRKPHQLMLSSVTSATLAGKIPSTGIAITFSCGTKLKLLASYDGYGEFTRSISHAHPDIPRLLALGRMSYSVEKRRRK